MTQKERRVYLIKELLHEQPRYASMEIPENEQEQKNCSVLFSIFVCQHQ